MRHFAQQITELDIDSFSNTLRELGLPETDVNEISEVLKKSLPEEYEEPGTDFGQDEDTSFENTTETVLQPVLQPQKPIQKL
jgi:hypothetical protein